MEGRKTSLAKEARRSLGKEGRFYGKRTLVGKGDKKRLGESAGSVRAFFLQHNRHMLGTLVADELQGEPKC